MLYVIFGFFGASIGGAFGFIVGMLGPQWFYRLANDSYSGPISVVNNYSVGWLIGGLLGGILGILLAHKITRRS